MLSMSTFSKAKFDNVRDTISEKTKSKENLQTINDKVLKEIKKKKLENVVEVKLDYDGLAIEFRDKLLFAPGSAKANPQSEDTIKQVMAIIASSPDKYRIVVEGHTDDTPLSGKGEFKSNWELSSARSLSLLKQFNERGVNESRMEIVSLAHTKPKVPYLALKGPELEKARAANRRVVIRLM